MSRISKKIKKKYQETNKFSLLVYLILRILVIVCAVLQFLQGEFGNTILCVFSLLLFTLPSLIEERLKIDIPSVLESIVYLFIFAAEILGEINNLYGIIPYWDTMLHTLNGFLCAGIGFSLIDLLNNNSEKLNLSPFYVALVAFCFSMTVGVCWEFFEYGADKLFNTDMQKDKIVDVVSSVELNPDGKNVSVVLKDIKETSIKTKKGDVQVIDGGYLDIGINDTMKDLIVNFIGAVVFSIFGFIYIKNRREDGFVRGFIPQKM